MSQEITLDAGTKITIETVPETPEITSAGGSELIPLTKDGVTSHISVDNLMEPVIQQAKGDILGSMTPSGSPTGSEVAGQSYRVSSSDVDQVFTNFLDAGGQPITVTTPDSGLLTKSNGSWGFVKDGVDVSGLIPKSDIVNTVTIGGATKVSSAEVAKSLYDTTAKIKAVPGKNLANPINFIENKQVVNSTGEVITLADWLILEVFSLAPGQTYVRSSDSGYGIGLGWIYDINDAPLVAVPAANASFTMPAGGVTFRVNVANAVGYWSGQRNTYQVEVGSVKTAYAPYTETIKLVDNSNTDVTVKLIKDGLISGDVSKPNSPARQMDLSVYGFGGGANLANPAEFIIGHYVLTSPGSIQFDINGEVVAGCKMTGYIKVKPNTLYSISGLTTSAAKAIQFSDINKVKLAATPGLIVTSTVFSFTTPANCEFLLATIDYLGQTPATQFMINEGMPIAYIPYIDGINTINGKDLVAAALKSGATINGKQIATTDMIDGGNKPIRLLKEGNYFYVRTSFDNDYDLVQKFTIGYVAVVNKNSCTDFVASYRIDKASIDSISVYEAGQLLSDQADDTSPLNTTAHKHIGAGHGLVCPVVTSSGHGKTASDLLSMWVDNGSHNFYLVDILDADTLLFYSQPTSYQGELITLEAVGGTTLTHVSGGVNTANITVNSQVPTQQFPVVKNLTNQVYADGRLITIDGLYYANEVKATCKYEIVDPNTLELVVPFTFNNGDSFVKVAIDYVYQPNGACVINHSLNFIREKRLAYWYGLQCVMLETNATYPRRFAYLTKVKSKDGKDYRSIVETTSAPSLTTFLTADLVDPTLPVDRYIQLLADSSGNKKIGFAMGINTEIGYGKNVLRAANAEHFQISALGKGYYRILEDFIGIGQVVNFVGYRIFYNAEKLTGDLSYKIKGSEYHILDAHTDNVKLPIAASEGLEITEVETVGTIDFATDVSTADGLLMSNTGYASATVKL